MTTYLALQTTQPDAPAALSLLAASMAKTRRLLAPLLAALALEVDHTAPARSPWCEAAQHALAGLAAADDARLSVHAGYLNGSHEFEHSRVRYSTSGSPAVSLYRQKHSEL